MTTTNRIEWLTTQEASEHLKMKIGTLYAKVQRNGIPYHRPEGSNLIRFNKAELDSWVMGSTRKEVAA